MTEDVCDTHDEAVNRGFDEALWFPPARGNSPRYSRKLRRGRREPFRLD